MENLIINKKIKDTKIAVAMSGGVDSSVVAVMLRKMGYNVTGFTMRLYSNSNNVNKNKSCCAGVDINDAVKIANQYDFPHHILDLQNNFYNNVIDDFVETYAKGKTPIPCIRCNETVKFRDMLNAAKKIKADALVTGHYVRRVGGLKNAKLFRALDNEKDQSYFLFSTTRSQLDYLRFPLGELKKNEVRKLADKFNLDVKNKKDSQDICFITNGSYNTLLKNLKPEAFVVGNIVNRSGEIIGEHKGIVNYTVGQRRKIGIGGNISPLYVININANKNEITVGHKEELKKSKVLVNKINWLSSLSRKKMTCFAKIKSDQKPQKGKIDFINNESAEFEFNDPQISICPGQACVFYKKEEVLGGGWIYKNSYS